VFFCVRLRPLYCVTSVAGFSGLSIVDCPFGFLYNLFSHLWYLFFPLQFFYAKFGGLFFRYPLLYSLILLIIYNLSVFPITYQQFTNRWEQYNILGVTYWSIICHLSRNAIDCYFILSKLTKQTLEKLQESYIILYRLANKVKYKL